MNFSKGAAVLLSNTTDNHFLSQRYSTARTYANFVK